MCRTNLSSMEIALVGISAASGEVIHEVPLPFFLGGFVGLGQYAEYDPKTTEVLCVGRDTQFKNQVSSFLFSDSFLSLVMWLIDFPV